MSLGSDFMVGGLGSFMVGGLDCLVMGCWGFMLCKRLEVVRGGGRVLLRLVRCLGCMVSIYVMRVLMDRLLVVDDLVVLWVGTGVSIVIVHLEDKAAFFNIDLA